MIKLSKNNAKRKTSSFKNETKTKKNKKLKTKTVIKLTRNKK